MSQISENHKKLVRLIVHGRLDIFFIHGRLIAVVVHEKMVAVVIGRHQQAQRLSLGDISKHHRSFIFLQVLACRCFYHAGWMEIR
jgi:hypothetical protein